MRFSWQAYWGGLPFPPPMDYVSSELSTMTCPSLVALHGMAHSFIKVHKPLCHKGVIHVLQSTGSQRVRHYWASGQQQLFLLLTCSFS